MVTQTPTKLLAVYVNCPSYNPKHPSEHAMLDHCWDCAPYWQRIPTCPVHGTMLRQPVRQRISTAEQGYCRACRKHYVLPGVQSS